MRRLLLIAVLFPATCLAQGAGYTFARSITIGSGASGTNTNFVLLFTGGSFMKTVANGGKLQNANGYDHIYSASSACTSPYAYETETGTYDATTGAIVDWIQVPSLGNGTVLYICYDNVSISTFQGGATGAAWDSTFKGVWHFPSSAVNGGQVLDSTTGASDIGIVNGNGAITAVTGQIANAFSFTTASNDRLEIATPHTSLTNITSKLTLSAWVKLTSCADAGNFGTIIVSQNTNSPFADNYHLRTNSGSPPCTLHFELYNGGFQGFDSTGTISTGVWTLVGVVIDETAGTKLTFYKNGASIGTPSYSTSLTSNASQTFWLMSFGSGRQVNGAEDEARVISDARSSAWMLTEYNNQNNPATFYTIGGELGGGRLHGSVSYTQ